MSRARQPAVYVLASAMRGTLYVGLTPRLISRNAQHKQDQIEGFTRKHRVHDLVWFELHQTMEPAILREKAIKRWKRAWKVELNETANPTWRDLCPDLVRTRSVLVLPKAGFRLSPE